MYAVFFVLFFTVNSSPISVGNSHLTVNVKTQKQEILKEDFVTNSSNDTVILTFNLQDGIYVTQLLDFRQGTQIFKVITLGQEELEESFAQSLCFVINLPKGNFISADAMSKLKQKNPNTIRVAEINEGELEFDMDMKLNPRRVNFLSSQMHFCADADATYGSKKDLSEWVSQKSDLDLDWTGVLEESESSEIIGRTLCDNAVKSDTPCICQRSICISWYPSGLKFCTGKDNLGKIISYRCGIKTSSSCFTFKYFVAQKQLCLNPYALHV